MPDSTHIIMDLLCTESSTRTALDGSLATGLVNVFSTPLSAESMMCNVLPALEPFTSEGKPAEQYSIPLQRPLYLEHWRGLTVPCECICTAMNLMVNA